MNVLRDQARDLFASGTTNGWDIAAALGYIGKPRAENTAKHVHDWLWNKSYRFAHVPEGRDTIQSDAGLKLWQQCTQKAGYAGPTNTPQPQEETPKMTTAAELRASQSNPRDPGAIQAFPEDLAGKTMIISSAHYRPSLYSRNNNSGGFSEYLILNFTIEGDKRKTKRWIQTQAVDIFKMFRDVPPSMFPVTGTFTVTDGPKGPVYSIE